MFRRQVDDEDGALGGLYEDMESLACYYIYRFSIRDLNIFIVID